MARSLSKKQRFDVFKRDSFTCQYCGRTPPAVVLECDHIKPVAGGGEDHEHNLITACFDCNRGKGAGDLGVAVATTAERAAELAERMEQVKAYEALLKKQKRQIESKVDKICEVFDGSFPGWALNDNARRSIRTFLKSLPFEDVDEAIHKACAKCARSDAFKYFCGICWNKIKRPGARY